MLHATAGTPPAHPPCASLPLILTLGLGLPGHPYALAPSSPTTPQLASTATRGAPPYYCCCCYCMLLMMLLLLLLQLLLYHGYCYYSS